LSISVLLLVEAAGAAPVQIPEAPLAPVAPVPVAPVPVAPVPVPVLPVPVVRLFVVVGVVEPAAPIGVVIARFLPRHGKASVNSYGLVNS
jgi:hypothetical protein